jgi:hypothetical protein
VVDGSRRLYVEIDFPVVRHPLTLFQKGRTIISCAHFMLD